MSLKAIYKNEIFSGKRFINKIIVFYLISILAIGTVLPAIRSDPTDSWWNPGWNYRKLLTMDTAKISGTLVNFPVLVQFTDSDLASHAQSTGNDIAFVLYNDNSTKLNHEIEYYNGATGALYAWVNITRLSSSVNTKVWMYYGNPGCSSQQNTYGTWNSKYKAVYHLDENGLPFVDSTSNKNNITSANLNGTGMAQTGGIYRWLHFNGTTNYLVVPFTMTGAYTVEAIANPDQITASGVVYSNEKTNSPVTGIAMGISSNAVYVTDGTLHRGLSPSSMYTPAKTTKWWADVVFAVGSKIWFYLDGANQTLTSQSYFTNYANYHTIGARYNGKYSAFWDGFVDEVRISSGSWNASWLKTCYDIQKDPVSFCSRGVQESAPSGGNQPPVFGTPVPSDGSINNPLGFTWSIPINDPEGDQFSWTIQCSNGQTNSGTSATNGTKSLSLSGLMYSTMYKVWVNGTDSSGSGVYTRRWYTFSTIINLPPVFGLAIPSNGSTNNPLSFSWIIPINDPEGNLFSWTIQCSNGQTNSGSGASNGTKSLALSGLTYLTTYKVWVNATDPAGSGLYTRRWFTFTIKAVNSPPVYGTPSPANGSTGNLLSLTWGIPINDPEGNVFSWTIQCSNGQANSGSGASNGTKSVGLSGLGYLTSYKVWVNATDPAGSGLYTRRWFTFTTKPANSPPVLGSPSPVNGSTGNLLSLTWSIPINDPEGNLFSWTIQCSNGQTNSGSGASNGTKSLALSGLTYLTTYKVWVNATDPAGSGLYTRRWFTFTTKQGNSPPVFGTPSPVNDSTGNWWSPPPNGAWIPWNIPINDPEGNRFSWTIQCSNGQSSSGTSPFNGTEYLAISTLSYSTTYKIWVNATDTTGSGLYTRKWYIFTTQRNGNNPPVFPRVTSPENGSISKGNQLSPSWLNMTWSIRINDLENNSFNWWIQCSNGQSNSSTGAKNGTKSLKLSYLAYSTTYKIWVNATDPSGSGLYIRKWYTFTTKANDPPVFNTPSLPNSSTGNSLSFGLWGIMISDIERNPFSWTIQCSNGQENSSTGASNGTKSLVLSGLMYSTTYTIWVNATDPTGSGMYTRKWFMFTTQGSSGNNPPMFGVPSPINSSSGRRLSLSWNIPVTDPDGTVFSWTIQCNNGQGISGSSASNGTKTLALSGLAYSTNYKIWVNATDPTGSAQFTRKWYMFTTEAIIPISLPTAKAWSPVTSAAGETRVGATVADINNDGRMEIVRSGINGIVVYNGTTGAVFWNKLTTMWDSHIPIEIIDLNKDGYLDVISSYDTGTRALSGKDGSQLWYNANAPLYNKHAVTGDINGDGYPEVFVCTAGANSGSPQGWVTALTHDGQIIAKVHTYFPCYGGLSLGDTNNDGVYELFMGERNIGYDGNVVGKGVRAFWASNLTERWCHPEMLSSSNCPTLVDTNKDGILEVVALAQTGGNGIAVYNSADGSVIHYSNIPGLKCHSNPTIYDIDGDGNLEIIVGGGSDSWGKPLVWDLYTWSPEAWLPFNCWEPPAIADINGDGRVEIIECTITNISIFDDNYVFRGSIPLNNNRSGSGYYGMSMIVAQDVDKDNLLELVINRYNQVYVYDTNGAAPNPRALSQFSYYSQHRGRSPYFTQY